MTRIFKNRLSLMAPVLACSLALAGCSGVDAAVSNPVTSTQSFPMHAVISGGCCASDGLGQPVVMPPSYVNSGTISRDDQGGYIVELPLIEFETYFDGEVVSRIKPTFAGNTRYSIPQDGPGLLHYAARASTQSTNRTGDNLLNLDQSRLAYATFGSIQLCRNPGASDCADALGRGFQYADFVFGQPTPVADIPLSGSAGYSGSVSASNSPGSVTIDGKASLSIEFGTTAVSGSLSSLTKYVDDGWSAQTIALPDYVVAGTLKPDGGLAGSLVPNANADDWINGQWSGSLYGPGAAEIGAVLSLPNSGYSAPFIGTLAAKRNGP